MSEEGKVEGTINAVTGLIKAVPVYQDAIQPAAKEVGKSLTTVAKAINVALLPVSGMVWGWEQIRDFVLTDVAAKLKDVPQTQIITPAANVAGPALDALRYTAYEHSLRQLYANLLANAMVSETASRAHPSFVEIIKQLTPDEAKLLAFMTTEAGNIRPLINIKASKHNSGMGAQNRLKLVSDLGLRAELADSSLTPAYLANLSRLGVLHTDFMHGYSDESHYARVINLPFVQEIKKSIEAEGRHFHIDKGIVDFTPLGAIFADICVISR